LNVIDNAISAIEIKKIPLEDGLININTFVNKEYIFIEIKDNGIGINKELTTKIFEPFYTTKAVGSGTGLGLSIAHTIVKNHHGEILVNSEENVGTELTIKLPIKQ